MPHKYLYEPNHKSETQIKLINIHNHIQLTETNQLTVQHANKLIE